MGEYKDKDWEGKYSGKSGGSACIGGDNLLWDCNTKQTILARDVQIGDSIRVALGGTDTNDDSTTSTCSDVYYVFHHEETDAAITFTIEDGSTFAVSYNHLVYVVGASFEVSNIESKYQWFYFRLLTTISFLLPYIIGSSFCSFTRCASW